MPCQIVSGLSSEYCRGHCLEVVRCSIFSRLVSLKGLQVLLYLRIACLYSHCHDWRIRLVRKHFQLGLYGETPIYHNEGSARIDGRRFK